MSATVFKICDFKRVQVLILGIRDFRLPPKRKAPHSNAITRIGMGSNHQSPSSIDLVICIEYV